MNKPIDITKKVGQNEVTIKDLKNKFILILTRKNYPKKNEFLLSYIFYINSELKTIIIKNFYKVKFTDTIDNIELSNFFLPYNKIIIL